MVSHNTTSLLYRISLDRLICLDSLESFVFRQLFTINYRDEGHRVKMECIWIMSTYFNINWFVCKYMAPVIIYIYI